MTWISRCCSSLFHIFEFEGIAIKAAILVMLDPFDFRVFDINRFAGLVFLTGKDDADIVNLLVHFQYGPAHELEIVFDQNSVCARPG